MSLNFRIKNMIGTIFLYIMGAIGLIIWGSAPYFVFPETFFQRHPIISILTIPLFISGSLIWVFGVIAAPIALFQVYIDPPSFILAVFAIVWMIIGILGAVWVLSYISQL